MAKTSHKSVLLARRKKHVRKRISGSSTRPRVSVYRSLRHIYVQVIDDSTGTTLASSSSRALKMAGGTVEAAKAVGKDLAAKAAGKSVKKVCFDRGGYLYHGRVKALADAAREAGLEF